MIQWLADLGTWIFFRLNGIKQPVDSGYEERTHA